jgi:hypothetical protein
MGCNRLPRPVPPAPPGWPRGHVAVHPDTDFHEWLRLCAGLPLLHHLAHDGLSVLPMRSSGVRRTATNHCVQPMCSSQCSITRGRW